jgi:hypothetical protein
VLLKGNFTNMARIRVSRIILIFSVLFLSNCKNTQITHKQSSEINISQASFSKIIPGEEGQDVIIRLTINMNDDDSSIQVDSILFQGNTKIPHVNETNESQELIIKIKAAEVGTKPYGSMELENDQAIIFYSSNNKKYFYHLKNIKENETIYLP